MKDGMNNGSSSLQLALTSLNHISIVCRSVERSLDFYQNVLGFIPIRRPESLKFEGAWLFNYGIGIHLLQSEDPEGMPKKTDINPKDNHISFQRGRQRRFWWWRRRCGWWHAVLRRRFWWWRRRCGWWHAVLRRRNPNIGRSCSDRGAHAGEHGGSECPQRNVHAGELVALERRPPQLTLESSPRSRWQIWTNSRTCESMAAVEKQLTEMGIPFIERTVEEGGISVDQLFFHDPDGFMIEICNCEVLPVVPLAGGEPVWICKRGASVVTTNLAQQATSPPQQCVPAAAVHVKEEASYHTLYIE